MNNETLHVITVLDRSGSMQGCEQRVISSYNEFIASHRMSGIEDCRVSLYIFDSVLETVYENTPLSEVPELTDKVYFPRGSTALYDTVGDVITRHQGKKRVFMTVDTDGWDNVSRKYSSAQLKGLVQECQNAGWEFTFLGADLTAEQTATLAAGMGLSASSTRMLADVVEVIGEILGAIFD